MKKVLTLMMVLMLAAFSLFAATSTAELEVKAYKKVSDGDPIYDARVIDALTGSLDVLTKGQTVDMSNYVNKFLGTFLSSNPVSTDNIGNKAIFSFHVGGNYIGTFKVNIKIQSLASYGKDGKSDRDESKYIAAQYWFQDYKLYFGNRTQSATGKGGDKETISSVSTPKSIGQVAYGSTPASFDFSWKVVGATTAENGTDVITTNTWDIEAMVAMILLSADTTSGSTTYLGYKSADNGVYMAPITITMTIS